MCWFKNRNPPVSVKCSRWSCADLDVKVQWYTCAFFRNKEWKCFISGHTHTQTGPHTHTNTPTNTQSLRNTPTKRRQCIRSYHAINQHSSSHWHVIFKRTFSVTIKDIALDRCYDNLSLKFAEKLMTAWEPTWSNFFLLFFRITGKFQPE